MLTRFGIALGGGGAKGLAHIPLLEVFDDLHIQPHRLSGTSIGSIIGALYASGLKAREIRSLVDSIVIPPNETFPAILRRRGLFKSLSFLDLSFQSSGLFKGESFLQFLFETMKVSTFEELKIPLKIVASDFWSSRQVVFSSGDLLPAIKASMGLPGIFTPVELNGRILLDGGGVNPVPHDILHGCDCVLAFDVMGTMLEDPVEPPHLIRSVLGMFDIMQNTIIRQKLQMHPPDIYIRPELVGIDILDFFRAGEIYRQAAPSAIQLRHKLCKLLTLDRENPHPVAGR
jgi:NTE family protein